MADIADLESPIEKKSHLRAEIWTPTLRTTAQHLLIWESCRLCLFREWGSWWVPIYQCGLGQGLSVPSGILIHPTVWPQYTNVTDRTTVS